MKKRTRTIILAILLAIGVGYIVYSNHYPREGKVFSTDIMYHTSKKCRDGLVMLGYYKVPSGITKDQCVRYHPQGDLDRVCANCGNGSCEPWENICTCPQDCE